MTESAPTRKLPPDVCPRCRRYKDPEDRLCETCAQKEKDFIAERQGAGAADSSTPLNKKEATGIAVLISLGMLVVPVAIGWKLVPEIRKLSLTFGGIWGQPLEKVFYSVIMPIGTALFIEFLLTVSLISTINNYRRHHPKKAEPKADANAAEPKP